MTFHSLRLHLIEPLIAGGYLVLLLIGIEARSRESWIVSLACILALAAIAWVMSFRRARRINDTPTSRIASAAQGYTELVGRGHHRPDSPVLSRITALPCVWYRYVIEQRIGNNKSG